MRAHLRPPGRLARWRSASKHLVEDGLEGGGGFRATVACQRETVALSCESGCGAVAGQNTPADEVRCRLVHNLRACWKSALLVHVRRAGFEAATSPRWSEAQEVMKAFFRRWPSSSKATTCHGWRARERGEQASAQAQPRARALYPHAQPVRRAGSEKVFATRDRFEKESKILSQRAFSFYRKRPRGPYPM